MKNASGERIKKNDLTRREFLWLTSLSAAGFLTGCATNPVTGETQLMLVSEDQEIRLDRENSPHQFSSDYGIVQDKALDDYIHQTGKKIADRTHRPRMPYAFHGVNATYINAYAFPGGSIAATRGILLTLENEAELAALLGHELGHVNARHTAQQMSKGLITQAVIGGIAAYAGTKSAAYGDLASKLGMVGAGALLASYSRDNEREADSLGMEYMVRAGYGSAGFVGLMEKLNSLSKHKLSATELLFATHPMSDERYRTAVETVRFRYQQAKSFPLYRDRYMDHTATLRTIKGAIEEMQNGEKEMAKEKYPDAETHFKNALKQAPGDYAGLVMMAKCQLAQEKYSNALQYTEKAKQVYPTEAQAYFLSGYAKIKTKNFDSAYQEFGTYEKLLPGNPSTIFFKGLALEGMQRIPEAAKEYYRYLQIVSQGEKATYAYQRLVQWGYIKPK